MKVKLLESVHEFNAIIVYKLDTQNLDKKKITYKKKPYIKSVL